MQISTDHLKAALVFAPKKDYRYYLNGVLIEWDTETVSVVATDGHRLFAATHPVSEPVEPGSVIVPYDDVKRALTGYKFDTIDFIAAGGPYLPILGGVTVGEIDGTYPDWRLVVPSKISGEDGQFDPRYVGDLAKAAKALGIKDAKAHIYHNGMSAALVTFGGREDCFAILMPRRSNETDQHALNVASAVSRPMGSGITSQAA